MKGARLPVAIWLGLVAVCALIVSRTEISTDLAAFLPSSPTPTQQILVDELREGVVSRLILIGVEGAPQDALAAVSRGLATRLEHDAHFAYVANGEQDRLRANGEFLLRHRYLLSDAVTPERFSVAGLRAALERQLDLLGSPASVLLGPMLPRDPTGEFLHLLEQLREEGGPDKRGEVWFSRDGSRALLVAQTRAPGFDLDAQEQAHAAIRAAFEQAARENHADGARVFFSGPGVFAVSSRAGIKQDALRFSVIATVLVSAILLIAYRSVRVLGLTLAPVASGVLAGIAAVGVGFGSVHGVTLGFGATLIGEAVDYAIYLFTNTAPDSPPQTALKRIWPTLRLGVLTSVLGCAAMLFSGFPGLAQLGLFTIAGLTTAAAVTRWVLPELVPSGYNVRAVNALAPVLLSMIARGRTLRIPLLVTVLVLAVWLAAQGATPWNDELSGLSPVSMSDQRLDESLRKDLGAPDARHLVVVASASEQAALQTAEHVGVALSALQSRGVLAGHDSPARYLPSVAAQDARQRAIPEPIKLRRDLASAAEGLPFRAGTFVPFIAETQAAKKQPALMRSDLQGTALALKLEALLAHRRGQWFAMLPLRGVTDAAALQQEMARFGPQGVVLLDLKRESDTLYHGYRARVLKFAMLGAGAIAVLLVVALRSLRRVWEVLAPLVAALIIAVAILAAGGDRLNIFHVVALLLVVGVGSNYTLFFERRNMANGTPERTVTSLFLCNLSTVIGFGVIGFAGTPVLSAIGSTVAIGAFLSLVFAAILTAELPPEKR
ncbi:MAG TPA: MMPL family transporter [Burkholderiales bacterium]|nr:MMPL family transporter [Burkholderiales bacterium]